MGWQILIPTLVALLGGAIASYVLNVLAGRHDATKQLGSSKVDKRRRRRHWLLVVLWISVTAAAAVASSVFSSGESSPPNPIISTPGPGPITATPDPGVDSVYLDFVKHASNGPERAAALYGAVESAAAEYSVSDSFNERSIAHGLMAASAFDRLWGSQQLTCGQGTIDGAVASYEVHRASGFQVRVLLFRGKQRLAQFPTLTFDSGKMVEAVDCQPVSAFDIDVEPPHPDVVSSALASTLAKSGVGDGTTDRYLAPGVAVHANVNALLCLRDSPRWWIAYGSDWTSAESNYIFYASDRSTGSNEGHLHVDASQMLITGLKCGEF